jgi:regulator of cell morphogenesis and NO signaling
METATLLDVRVIEPRHKHPAIFKTFDELANGTLMTIINDHDPLPLYYQFKAERPGIFEWEYIEKGPQVWKVNITKSNTAGETVADVVRNNPKAAKVLKKYNIDFCCKGKRLFELASAEAGITAEALKNEISQATESTPVNMRAEEWSLPFLADYIVNNHHAFVQQSIPEITGLLQKVENAHGESHPHLLQLTEYFKDLAQDMITHMMKEEMILFPAIKDVANFVENGKDMPNLPFPTVRMPIAMMEDDHSHAGELLMKIRKLSNNFTPPSGACNSFRILYSLLEDFEDDLHQHIHLENNILFPKAIELEKLIK